jgi:hypothetical protein
VALKRREAQAGTTKMSLSDKGNSRPSIMAVPLPSTTTWTSPSVDRIARVSKPAGMSCAKAAIVGSRLSPLHGSVNSSR